MLMSQLKLAVSNCRYEKASSAHEAAKEMVTLAEQGFAEKSGGEFDQAWQEMLNHATNRVRNETQQKLQKKRQIYRTYRYVYKLQ